MKANLLRNLSALVLCLLLLPALSAGNASAAAPKLIDQGECGENLTWTLDSEGTLTVSGTWRMTSFNSAAPWYLDRDSIKAVVIEPGVTSIGKGAFSQCRSLTRVSLPDSLEKIEQSAFSGCEKLPEIVLPDSVSSLGNYAFSNCHALKSVTLSNRLSSIPMQAFMRCYTLETVTIPDSVKSLGWGAFQDCRKLKTAVLGNGVKTIEEKAFQDCSNLQTVTAGNGLQSIGKEAFMHCEKLHTVTVGNSLQSIGDSAFNNCASLTEITLPGSLSVLMRDLFTNKLTDVYFGGTEEQWAALISSTVPYGNNEELKNANIHYVTILYYDGNGGSGYLPLPEILEPGSEITLPENQWTPPVHKQFSAWTCGDRACLPGETIQVDKTMTVSAKWTEEDHWLDYLGRYRDDYSAQVTAFSRENAVVWCAAYDDSGRMLEAKWQPFTGTEPTPFEFRFDSSDFTELRAFLLSGDGVPLCGSIGARDN